MVDGTLRDLAEAGHAMLTDLGSVFGLPMAYDRPPAWVDDPAVVTARLARKRDDLDDAVWCEVVRAVRACRWVTGRTCCDGDRPEAALTALDIVYEARLRLGRPAGAAMLSAFPLQPDPRIAADQVDIAAARLAATLDEVYVDPDALAGLLADVRAALTGLVAVTADEPRRAPLRLVE